METCYINGRFLSQEATGVQRYAEELVKTLDTMIDDGGIDAGKMRFILLTPAGLIRTIGLKHIPTRVAGHLSGHLWEQLELPRYARRGLLINLCNTGPVLSPHQMVTIHDAGFMAMPESYSRSFRTWYRLLLRRLGRTADVIVTVSDFSRTELIERLSISPARLHVIRHGREHFERLTADDTVITRHHLEQRPFLLAVSSRSPRKNFAAIVKAMSGPKLRGIKIVIAGGANPRVFGDEPERMPEHVHHLGYVTDEELKSLYRHAMAIIYPSLYEGFGLPPLEAMACGCPVIVSDIPPHHEVCGDAAIYCDPLSPDDIAEKIALVMNDPELRRQMQASGFEQARTFSWRQSAAEFYAIVKTLSLSQ